MLRQALFMFGWIDLPKFFQAEAELLRFAAFGQTKFGNQLLAEIAARAFGKQSVLGVQLHAAGEAGIRFAVFADTHVAGGDAANGARFIVEDLGRGKAWI